jgi:hypothetical protein
MVTTTVLFALTWLAQRPGYNHDEVRTLALVLGIAAEALLAVGGNIGGANVFVYGIRVLGRPDTPVAKALNPLGPPGEDGAARPAASSRRTGSAQIDGVGGTCAGHARQHESAEHRHRYTEGASPDPEGLG